MNVEFKILEHIFSFGENNVRSWNEDHTKMTKGITFSREELIQLREALAKEELESGSSYAW